MDKKIVRKNDVSIAVVYSDEIFVTDAQSGKPLKDFIFESNRGNAIFLVADEQAAIDKLSDEILGF